MNRLNRRQFASLSAAALLSTLARPSRASEAPSDPKFFHVALLADTHIVDRFFPGGNESDPEERESFLHTSERLAAARTLINSLERPVIERTFILGDLFHNYPSPDYEFYFHNKTRLDNLKELVDGFRMPVHLGFGNHDYEVKTIDREMSHRLFRTKFQTEPYYAVEHGEVRFLHTNNFLGETQDPHSAKFSPMVGTFGEKQLNWIEAQLEARKPTFLFLHYPLIAIAESEVADYSLPALLRKYKETIRLVASGHVHRWMNLGRIWGPPHYTVASTRYDPDAYMLLRIDRKTGEWSFLNADRVEWNTHYSRAYVPAS